MYTIVGYCPKCGAPIYAPELWMSIAPPPSYYSCNCFPKTQTIVTTGAGTGKPQNWEATP